MEAYMVFTYLKALLLIKPLLGSTTYAFPLNMPLFLFLNTHDINHIRHKKRAIHLTHT